MGKNIVNNNKYNNNNNKLISMKQKLRKEKMERNDKNLHEKWERINTNDGLSITRRLF